jgi:hypothetical protein
MNINAHERVLKLDALSVKVEDWNEFAKKYDAGLLQSAR